jgi:hypothetical protein
MNPITPRKEGCMSQYSIGITVWKGRTELRLAIARDRCKERKDLLQRDMEKTLGGNRNILFWLWQWLHD